MGWKMVGVLAWVREDSAPPGSPPGIWGGTPPEWIDTTPPQPQPQPPGIWPGPGYPAHPIAPGGPPPHVEHPIPPGIWPQPPGGGGGPGGPAHPEHPIPPTVWPEPPGSATPPWAPHPEHPIPPTVWPTPPGGGGGGESPPGFWGGRPPEWVDTTPPGPQPSPPGIWGGRPPEYIDIGGPGPQPPPGSVMPPIYLPPVIWPEPPEGFPSFDPDQLPQHPDLPDLNHGVWYWVDNDGAMCRAFLAQVVRASADLPDYQPSLPPEESQPGEWVVVLINAQAPSWAWIPSAHPATTPDDPHAEHHGAKA